MSNSLEKNDNIDSFTYNSYINIPLIKIENTNSINTEDMIVSEFPLDLFINEKYSNTFLCSPNKLKELVVGYIYSKNLIDSKDDILDFKLDKNSKRAEIKIKEIHPSLDNYEALNINPIKNNSLNISASEIYKVMEYNLNASQIFKNTAAVHNISIYHNNGVVISCDDVARHNALDKAIGHCILNNIPLDESIVFVSGRFSFEMMKKATRAKIPIIVAKSATTSLSMEAAEKLNITLVGFVRGKRMNIYTNPHRIILE